MATSSSAPHAVSAGNGPLLDVAQLLLPAIRWDDQRGYEAHRPAIERALELGVGGFIFFGGTTDAAAALTAELHERSRIPLLIGADLERGAGQQFRGLTGLPPLAALGALGDQRILRRAASITAREARSVGVNWVYAPDCDLDLLPDNPIIGTRSLGGDPEIVSELASEWIDACQSAGALACAKHFPGHGRTLGDSHMELPVVDASREELHRQDLEPFRWAVDAGVASVMTAHVSYPALDPSGAPATHSARILGELLREHMGFDGLIVTDAMIMDGILEGQDEREASVRALEAGCDLLLYPSDLESVARAIARAVEERRLSMELVMRAAERRTRWAEWAGRTEVKPVDDADWRWAADICERVVHSLGDPVPSIGPRPELAIVDDDLGGPYPAPSRQPLVDALTELGHAPVMVEEPDELGGAPLVVALFGDIRSWKGRPGYSDESKARVRAFLDAAAARDAPAVVVQFSHPRLARELGKVPALLCAWGGEAVMQAAAARKLVGR